MKAIDNHKAACEVKEVPAPEVDTDTRCILCKLEGEKNEDIKRVYSEQYLLARLNERENELLRAGTISAILIDLQNV